MKLNQKGFTIIEIMLATVLFSIVALAVIYFISTGTKTSNEAEYQINLQTEAQVIMNQLSSFTIEGNDVTTYSIGDNLAYVIYHNDKVLKKPNKEIIILYRKSEKKLYYYEVIGVPAAGETKTTTEEIATMTEEIKNPAKTISIGQLMGEDVEEFTINVKENPVVSFHVKIAIQKNEFVTESSVKYRSQKVTTTTPLVTLS